MIDYKLVIFAESESNLYSTPAGVDAPLLKVILSRAGDDVSGEMHIIRNENVIRYLFCQPCDGKDRLRCLGCELIIEDRMITEQKKLIGIFKGACTVLRDAYSSKIEINSCAVKAMRYLREQIQKNECLFVALDNNAISPIVDDTEIANALTECSKVPVECADNVISGFGGRMSQKKYCICYLSILAMLGIIYALLQSYPQSYFVAGPALKVLSGLVGLLTIPMRIFRAHDTGVSGWWILVPLYDLYLLLAPGNEGSNKYGSDPRLD